jgi:hypothetical protein
MGTVVKSAFQPNLIQLEVKSLVPSRTFDARERAHQKYKQIAASIASIGLIEPLVVFPIGGGKYRVLDGHRRLDILKAGKDRHVECLLSSDDEAYTYNHRVNYLSTVSEHHMILRALEHNTEARIAEALNVDVATIREKCRLLNGVCREAIEILKEKRVNPRAFAVLRKMKPVRQVEASQLMVASNMYSGRFAAALLAGTRDELLVSPERDRPKQSLSAAQKAQMEFETDTLLQDVKVIEESYGADVLTLSVSCRYVQKLLGNTKVRTYVAERHPEIQQECQSIVAAVLDRTTPESVRE